MVDEFELLKHEPDIANAIVPAGGRAEMGNPHSIGGNGSMVGFVVSRDEIKQGGFPRSARPT